MSLQWKYRGYLKSTPYICIWRMKWKIQRNLKFGIIDDNYIRYLSWFDKYRFTLSKDKLSRVNKRTKILCKSVAEIHQMNY